MSSSHEQQHSLGAASCSGTASTLASEPLILCRLCLCEWPRHHMYQLIQCRCLYCQECVKQYLTVMIREGNVLAISCPDAQCQEQGVLESQEISSIVELATLERYERLRFKREVELDPCRMWCPEVGCETVCHVCMESRLKSAPIKCPNALCGQVFCSVCKNKWHTDKSCDESLRAGPQDDIGIFFSPDEDAMIKRCPLCHIPIERNDGCAQMMCRRCKHVFCWYCLESLDDDFLLRHYDKGPCKDKLGHSRASVIWHRTQVVGTFAGFGMLLLVASPFLLLAAPCILCCKCKSCKACTDQETDVMM